MKTERGEVMRSNLNQETIAALATGRGGAIGVIRVSGPDAVAVADAVFVARSGKPLSEAAGYTVHFGEVVAGGSGGEGALGREVVDEVLVSVFRAPHSYTGEDAVEISCHGSSYIEARILGLLIEAGARAAEPGEFTMRAFLAGKMDLAQAEAVADLIAAGDRAQHRLAMDQMKGGVSSALAGLREELVQLAALLELELDFGEEDVAFADRGRLKELAEGIEAEIERLKATFEQGNAIREGVAVAIVGRPNAGKSTLLNALAGDERAMVSDIAGTTRDRIEERVVVGGVGFRFVDTAGLRATDDELERMGIERTRDAIRRARVVMLVMDAVEAGVCDIEAQVAELGLREDQQLCVVLNKVDVVGALDAESGSVGSSGAVLGTVSGAVSGEVQAWFSAADFPGSVFEISAKTGFGLDALRDWLVGTVDVRGFDSGAAVVSGARHFEALSRASHAVGRVLAGLRGGFSASEVCDSGSGLSSDLLAAEVREVLHHLGSITGDITSSEVLGAIFSKFCIGK